jgi:hypothetical protein
MRQFSHSLNLLPESRPEAAMATRPDGRMMEPDMNPKDLWLEEIYRT